MRWGLTLSGDRQTGQSDAIHSPEACASRGGQIDHPSGLVDGGGLHRGDLMLPQRLAHDVEPAGERRINGSYAPLPQGLAGPDRGRRADFPGLTSSAWALASAEARAADQFTGSGHGSAHLHATVRGRFTSEMASAVDACQFGKERPQ